jgi:hypothetical protein
MRSASGGAADLSSDRPSEDGPSQRAAIVQPAEKSLGDSVEVMRRKLRLTRGTAEIVNDIKATMNSPLPPYNFTVIQTLCERHRADDFNERAAGAFPAVRKKMKAIRDLATAQGASARKARKLEDNAWKWDHAADRRVREGSAAPHKGRPEVYDRAVVWAFADAIARAAGREGFATGHHGDVTITEKDEKGGPMFRVLVASVRWAMMAAWQVNAPPGTKRPTVKPEGILTVIKRARLAKPTD